jgi:fatty acid desaturase
MAAMGETDGMQQTKKLQSQLRRGLLSTATACADLLERLVAMAAWVILGLVVLMAFVALVVLLAPLVPLAWVSHLLSNAVLKRFG